MKQLSFNRLTFSLPIACVVLISGCATRPQSLYYWGDYQTQIYNNFTKENGPEAQITRLEAGLEKARAAGKPVAPGYNAHLGILYAQKEQSDQMLKYFDAERTLYPESRKYMDFLTKKFQNPQ